MTSKSIITTVCIMLLAVMAYTVRSNAQANEEAEKFVHEVSVASLFEVESSTLALVKAKDPKVQDMAQQIITDHSKINNDLRGAVASAKLNVEFPRSLDEKHREIIDSLSEEVDADFDEDFIGAQEDAHNDAIDLFEDYAEDGTNPTLRQFAARTLPILKQHKKAVENLDE